MKVLVTCLAAFLLSAAAEAQATTNDDDAKAATVAADPGRQTYDPRGDLSGRGGPNAAGTDNTFSATIGSQIFSTIGTPIQPTLPTNQR